MGMLPESAPRVLPAPWRRVGIKIWQLYLVHCHRNPGSSILLNDSRFVMLKPTISRSAFGIIMLQRG